MNPQHGAIKSRQVLGPGDDAFRIAELPFSRHDYFGARRIDADGFYGQLKNLPFFPRNEAIAAIRDWIKGKRNTGADREDRFQSIKLDLDRRERVRVRPNDHDAVVGVSALIDIVHIRHDGADHRG